MPALLIVTLNARLRPLDRGEIYEDPLDDLLKAADLGSVIGGGTHLGTSGEPQRADLEIELADAAPDGVRKIITVLERLGAPKGSVARLDGDDPIPFGVTEGVGIYLNGTDLAPEVYRDSDVNELIANLDDALGGDGQLQSYWEGPTETALYYYGPSGASIRKRIAPVIARTALCERCRVVDLT